MAPGVFWSDFRAQPGHLDWRVGKRACEPEAEANSLAKLQARMVAQLSAGEMPHACLRRAPLAQRSRTHCASFKRKREKQVRVDASVKRLRV